MRLGYAGAMKRMKHNLLSIVWLGLSTVGISHASEPLVGLVLPAGEGDGRYAVVDEDYGSFRWIVVAEGNLAALPDLDRASQVLPRPYDLDLGGVVFDPLESQPSVPQGRAPAADREDLYMVQMVGPSRATWLEGLEGADLRVVQYIHPFTYVVWGLPEALDSIQSAVGVRWAGAFDPAFRVLPRWRDLGAEVVGVRILIYRGANVDAVIRGVEALGGLSRGTRVVNDTWVIVGFDLAGDALSQAAAVAGVYSIQLVPTDGGLRGEMSNQINVNEHDLGLIAFPGYLDWLDAAGLDGSGVVIANIDSGVQEDHPDLVSRFLPCSGTTCGGGTSSPHGTHTAGIMAADGISGTTDGAGFLRGLGVAPGAEMIEQLYSPFFLDPGGMLLLMEESHANGAEVSGNSWGPSGSPRGYDDDTLQVDIGVRDADPQTPGNQGLNYILSIMNGYGGTSSQGTPDEAKNIFTIGSTKMQNNDLTQIPDVNDLSSNSAHGPALDGRIIPHMVAPGCSVDSTVPVDSYNTMCGTSMASPHVSGGVALFIEARRAAGAGDPSPAMVKAAFLAVAHDLAGFSDADGGTLGHPFDAKQGWGRMDLEAVLVPEVPVLYRDAPVVFDETGEIWNVGTAAADPSEPVRIMLVWTDAPGHGLGGTTPAWNNDLDLEVEVDGQVFRGNGFNSVTGWSEAGGMADPMNNTEGVFLPPGETGEIVIRVVASNISSDGVPGVGDTTDQDFALVCYNCGPLALFADGFETGDASAWSISIP
jgi:subtilisin family serine protease